MTRTAIYCRISRDDSGEGLGVQRQEADCRALAARLGWDVDDRDVHVDNDVSAFSGRERPRYVQLMAAIEARRYDRLIAWHPDRLHRNVRELEDFIDLVESTALEVRTVMAGPVDLSTSSGRATARVAGVMARQFSERNAESLRRKQLELAEEGKIGGKRRRYGFDGYDVVEAEAEVVREMTKRVLAGDSCRSIAADLNRRNVPTLTTTRAREKELPVPAVTWAGASVAAIVRKAENAGLRIHRGEVIGLARWPAIVERDDWEAACRIFKAPERLTASSNARRWLLSRLALCGVCGGAMGSSGKGSKAEGSNHTVYRCVENLCFVRSAERVDEYVNEVIVQRLSRPDAIDLLGDGASDAGASARDDAAEIRQRLAQSGEDLANDLMTREQVIALTKALRARLSDAERQIEASQRGTVFEGLIGVDDVRAAWQETALARRRAVLDALATVTLHRAGFGPKKFRPETVDIEWKQPASA